MPFEPTAGGHNCATNADLDAPIIEIERSGTDDFARIYDSTFPDVFTSVSRRVVF